MPLLSDSFLEMVMTAAVPGLAGGGATDGPVEQTYRSPAHAAIGAAVDDSRRTGRWAAVCLMDLTRSDARDRTSATPEALEAAVTNSLRRVDRSVRVGDTLVVVAPGLNHPSEGDRLAERLRAIGAASERGGAVGLALYPVHGRDAATLLDSARASALRAQLGRGLADGSAAVARPAVS